MRWRTGEVHWRTGEISSEAYRNLATWSGRSLIALIATVFLAALQVIVAMHDDSGLESDLSAQNALGRNVVVLSSAPDAKQPIEVDQSSCSALALDPDVVAAGTFSISTPTTITQAGPQVPVVFASPTLLPGLTRSATLIGSDLAGGGAHGRMKLSTTRFGVVDTAVLAPMSASLPFDSSLIVPYPAHATTGDSCVAILDRYVSAARVAQTMSSSVRATGGTVVARLDGQGGTDPVRSYHRRTTRWVWLVFGIAGALISLAATHLRSSESAAYRLSGTTRTDLIRLYVVEQIMIAGIGVAISAQTVLMFHARFISPGSTLSRSICQGLVWLGTYGLLLAMTLPRNALEQAKDR